VSFFEDIINSIRYSKVPNKYIEAIDKILKKKDNIHTLLMENNQENIIKKLIEDETIKEISDKRSQDEKFLRYVTRKRAKYWFKNLNKFEDLKELEISTFCAFLLKEIVKLSDKGMVKMFETKINKCSSFLSYEISTKNQHCLQIFFLKFLEEKKLIKKKHLIFIIKSYINSLLNDRYLDINRTRGPSIFRNLDHFNDHFLLVIQKNFPEEYAEIKRNEDGKPTNIGMLFKASDFYITKSKDCPEEITEEKIENMVKELKKIIEEIDKSIETKNFHENIKSEFFQIILGNGRIVIGTKEMLKITYIENIKKLSTSLQKVLEIKNESGEKTKRFVSTKIKKITIGIFKDNKCRHKFYTADEKSYEFKICNQKFYNVRLVAVLETNL